MSGDVPLGRCVGSAAVTRAQRLVVHVFDHIVAATVHRLDGARRLAWRSRIRVLCWLQRGKRANGRGLGNRGHAMADGPETPDKPDPQYWRERAKIARVDAERLSNPTARRRMFGVAASYERLAERIERRVLKRGTPK